MSLNAFLMDDELEPQEDKRVVKAFTNTAPGEDPVLREDVTLIATLEALSIDLNDLEQSIGETGGMTRTIAMEAHIVIPTFLNGDYALGTFTDQPTKVGLTYALESIENEKLKVEKKLASLASKRESQKVND